MVFIKPKKTKLSTVYLLLCISLLCSKPLPLIAATCNSLIPESTPTAQFTDNADGTVTDNTTGLMWARCTLGSNYNGSICDTSVTKTNWQQANESGALSSLAGYIDWRLPNIKELQTLVEHQCYLPAINEIIFSSDGALDTRYWTSTPSTADSERVWVVDFNTGLANTYDKDDDNEVRLVRGGL